MPLSKLRFVIIEHDEFIAADMAAGLRDISPNCSVIRLRDVTDASGLPLDPARLTVFITGDRLEGIDATGLTDLAAAQGAGIVVREGFDSNAAVEARGFHSLRSPFTDAALLAVAQELAAGQAA